MPDLTRTCMPRPVWRLFEVFIGELGYSVGSGGGSKRCSGSGL
jgi:hypothetical protein